MTLILLIFEGFTSADGDTSVLLQGLVGAVNDFNLWTARWTWRVQEVKKVRRISTLRVYGDYNRLSPSSKHHVGICVPHKLQYTSTWGIFLVS